MRKLILVASSLILSSAFSLSALAQDDSNTVSNTTTATPAVGTPTAGGTMMPMHHHEHNGPCSKIFAACKSAGFGKDAGKDKSMWRHCVKPTLMGQSVPGVTVDPNDAQACKSQNGRKNAVNRL